MIGLTSALGVVFLVVGIFALVKFAHGTLTAVASFLLILVSLFFIFGGTTDFYRQGTDYLNTNFADFKGLTGGAVMGRHVMIGDVNVQGDESVISVANTGTEFIDPLEVYVNGEPASIDSASTLLPGTQGTIIINGALLTGDAVMIKSGEVTDEFIYGYDGARITGGVVVSPLIN